MNIYITYDRYEHNEWLQVYHIDTNRKRAIKHFKEVDLVDFITYGPDDCHSFQLQKVRMPKILYKKLCQWVKDEEHCEANPIDSLHNLLVSIYEEKEIFDVETILCTDGCSDYWEIIEFYCIANGMEYNDDTIEEVQQLLCNDDELFEEILREYIELNYCA